MVWKLYLDGNNCLLTLGGPDDLSYVCAKLKILYYHNQNEFGIIYA